MFFCSPCDNTVIVHEIEGTYCPEMNWFRPQTKLLIFITLWRLRYLCVTKLWVSGLTHISRWTGNRQYPDISLLFPSSLPERMHQFWTQVSGGNALEWAFPLKGKGFVNSLFFCQWEKWIPGMKVKKKGWTDKARYPQNTGKKNWTLYSTPTSPCGQEAEMVAALLCLWEGGEKSSQCWKTYQFKNFICTALARFVHLCPRGRELKLLSRAFSL